MVELRVDLVVFSLQEGGLRVLLQEGGGEGWRLPGSPLDVHLSLEEASRRTLSEAFGHNPGAIEQLFTCGEPDRVPGRRVVSCVYLALLRAGSSAPAVGSRGAWHDPILLPAMVHDHSSIVAAALSRLRNKLEFSSIGFDLLPEQFTLPELQRAYEAVLARPLDKRNFRRRILAAGVIQNAGGFRSTDGRPARLYRYREEAVSEARTRRSLP